MMRSGMERGTTVVNDTADSCAAFCLLGVRQNRVIGGLNKVIDGSGEILFRLNIPSTDSESNVYVQAAYQSTCPEECVANLIEHTIEWGGRVSLSDTMS